MLLFIRFFPRGSLLKAKSGDLSEQSDYRQALTVVALCVIHAVLSILISVFIYYLQPQLILWWAGFLGLQATILTSVQYFPQIWMTYRLKHIGSLSIPMMCIQTPGGFVLAASMYARLGPSGWSQWCIYLAVASCQGVLLVMAIYYEYFTAKKPPLEDVPYAPLGHSGAAAESSPDSLSQRSERAALMDHVDPELSP